MPSEGIRPRADYRRAGARVVGVSPDSVEAIARFRDKYGLDFTLLAPKTHDVVLEALAGLPA